VQNVEARNRESRGRPKENIRREVRAGCDAREADRCRDAIGHVGNPTMFAVAMRENRRNRKCHHCVARRETASLSQRPATALEKSVGILSIHGNVCRPLPPRNRLRNDHQNCVIDIVQEIGRQFANVSVCRK
jgi:hypothetical protein